MSITLLCLVKGNALANAFPVHIDGNSLVGDLKEAIKDKIDVPVGFKAKDLKLWKVTIPDDRDDLLSSLSLNDGDELLATKKISKYFPDSPAEEHIHVLLSAPDCVAFGSAVEPPVSTATSSREQELLEQVTSLQELFKKSTHGTYFLPYPKRKPNKWTADIEHATLDGLKEYIRKMYQPPALENNGAEQSQVYCVHRNTLESFLGLDFPKNVPALRTE